MLGENKDSGDGKEYYQEACSTSEANVTLDPKTTPKVQTKTQSLPLLFINSRYALVCPGFGQHTSRKIVELQACQLLECEYLYTMA